MSAEKIAAAAATAPPGSATILKLIDIKKSDINNLDLKKLRIDLINSKKDELFNLYSQSLLSKLKNTTLIEYLDG